MTASQISLQQQPPEESIPSPAHLDGVAYLYGHPLLGSLSPLLHQTIYDALDMNWKQIPLSRSDTSAMTFPPPYTPSPPIGTFLTQTHGDPKFVGASVTMPWKVSIMPHLDELTEAAKQCGACNTIFIRNDNATHDRKSARRRTFIGTNTDCIGIREALLQNRLAKYIENRISNPYRDNPALVIGGGGTARAAIYALRTWLDVSKIYIINRDAAEISAILADDNDNKGKCDEEDKNKAEIIPITDISQIYHPDFERPEAIISGIPNYPPRTPEEIRTRKIIEAVLQQHENKEKGVILEMCYHPAPWTAIAELASQAGWKVILGTEAMIWQGLQQAKLWTGRDVASQAGLVERVQEVVAEAMAERLNGTEQNL
jgi:quinate dehydrogenase